MNTLFKLSVAGGLLSLLLSLPVVANPPVVSVMPVKTEMISPTVMISGQVYSRTNSSVSAGVAGRLLWVAEAGTVVEQGDVLARLDKRPFALEVKKFEAEIRRTEIKIARLETEVQRMTTLAARQATSAQEVDNLQADLAMAYADQELLQLQLEEAQDNLERTLVKAPFDGVVTERFQHISEDVSVTQPLLKLVDLEHLEVRFHGPLHYSEFSAATRKFEVLHADGHYQLQLRSLIPVSDERSQTFTGSLTIPPELKGKFRIGEFVTVAVPAAFARETFVVPRDALVLDESKTQVYVLDANDKAQAVAIAVDGGQGDYLRVQGNLKNGQRVVVRGAGQLRHGSEVRVLSAQEFPLATLN